MTAGLPGIGLGGIFVVLSALVMPIAGALQRRAVRPTRRLLALAVGSTVVGTAAIALTFKALGVAVFESSLGAPMIVFSLLILAAVVVVPEIQYWISGVRPTEAPPPIVPSSGAQTGDANAGREDTG